MEINKMNEIRVELLTFECLMGGLWDIMKRNGGRRLPLIYPLSNPKVTPKVTAPVILPVAVPVTARVMMEILNTLSNVTYSMK